MYKEVELRLTPEDAASEETLRGAVARVLRIGKERVRRTEVTRRSVDARQRQVMMQLTVGVHVDSVEERERVFQPAYHDVSSAPVAVVVGAGPAGLFAALRLIEGGIRPIVLERGKAVEERKKDIAALYRTGEVNPDSNFGFGEGGAGTFSDGKLYTRSKKRGDVKRTLEILVHHGADECILIDAHPHIGTDKLPSVIVRMRKTIEQCGGEVRFNNRVTDFIFGEEKRVEGVVACGEEVRGAGVILATGHSARDVYRLLHRRGVRMEPKDFAVGLRVEHPQELIDRIQYHLQGGRGAYLPAAEYCYVTNIDGRGVYSFCMCPGGVVVPAVTAQGQQVVNGMSASGRNTPWANAAIVTSVGEMELERMHCGGLFGGMDFQERLEALAADEGGGRIIAPAQRLTDFLSHRGSSTLPQVSYRPGVVSSPIHEWFPSLLEERLRAGLNQFGKKSRGYVTEAAVLMGVETRTSSPLRILRDKESCCHVEMAGLYPCGEGAGYAGGIVSSAMDGERCAESLLAKMDIRR